MISKYKKKSFNKFVNKLFLNENKLRSIIANKNKIRIKNIMNSNFQLYYLKSDIKLILYFYDYINSDFYILGRKLKTLKSQINSTTFLENDFFESFIFAYSNNRTQNLLIRFLNENNIKKITLSNVYESKEIDSVVAILKNSVKIELVKYILLSKFFTSTSESMEIKKACLLRKKAFKGFCRLFYHYYITKKKEIKNHNFFFYILNFIEYRRNLPKVLQIKKIIKFNKQWAYLLSKKKSVKKKIYNRKILNYKSYCINRMKYCNRSKYDIKKTKQERQIKRYKTNIHRLLKIYFGFILTIQVYFISLYEVLKFSIQLYIV